MQQPQSKLDYLLHPENCRRLPKIITPAELRKDVCALKIKNAWLPHKNIHKHTSLKPPVVSFHGLMPSRRMQAAHLCFGAANFSAEAWLLGRGPLWTSNLGC